MSFSFAQIWSADKDSLEEVADDDQGDSWAQTLQKITAEREKVQGQEIVSSGRGTRRRAAAVIKVSLNHRYSHHIKIDLKLLYQPNVYVDSTAKRPKETHKSKSANSDGSAYSVSEIESDGESDDQPDSFAPEDLPFEPREKKGHPKSKSNISPPFTNGVPLSPIQNQSEADILHCGLCGQKHGDCPGDCLMTDRSEVLAEFREMLIVNADDEPWERRVIMPISHP